MELERDYAINILETILFVSDTPVPLEKICTVIEGISDAEVRSIVEELNERYKNYSLSVVEIAEGYQLRTKPDFAQWVKKFHKLNRSTKLSRASLETLAIIAYRQPITRQEIEDIRGVDSSGPVKTLLDKNLVKGMGRKKVAGKPMTFGTTKKFLEYFGLIKLSDLPLLKDYPEEGEEGLQESLDLQLLSSDGKLPEDIELEEDAAMIEPADEDYEESESSEKQMGEEADEDFEETYDDSEGETEEPESEEDEDYENIQDEEYEDNDEGEEADEDFEETYDDSEGEAEEPESEEDEDYENIQDEEYEDNDEGEEADEDFEETYDDSEGEAEEPESEEDEDYENIRDEK